VSYADRDGGPAFPFQVTTKGGSFNVVRGHTVPGGSEDVDIFTGMTIRDWFAGQVLAGLAAWGGVHENGIERGIPEAVGLAYKAADAMLAERAKGSTS
jgi:hypothetical protein